MTLTGDMALIKKRFWKKVKVGDLDECWLWTASLDSSSYGNMSVNNKTYKANRLSYYLNKGDIPPGMLVLHICDNPPCVNPRHLFLGTQKDNVHDCVRKNRMNRAFGKDHGRAKFNKYQVQLIRAFYKEFKISPKVLCDWTGTSSTAIRLIILKKNWKNLADWKPLNEDN